MEEGRMVWVEIGKGRGKKGCAITASSRRKKELPRRTKYGT